MPGESIRFIHASDFHLESPLGDLDDLPPPLRDAMATAPHEAVKAIFEAALAKNIDFVVLTGDLLNPQAAGPYGMNLLLEQFEMLERLIAPFERGENATPIPGFGLGLTIVSAIAQEHGGRLSFEPGREGAIARLKLPR